MTANEPGFSLEIIRDYLINQGGKVEYHKLIKHFRHALADPANKEARILFKDLVNKIAVVTNEQDGKYLNLRSQFALNSSRPSSVTSITSSSLSADSSLVNINQASNTRSLPVVRNSEHSNIPLNQIQSNYHSCLYQQPTSSQITITPNNFPSNDSLLNNQQFINYQKSMAPAHQSSSQSIMHNQYAPAKRIPEHVQTQYVQYSPVVTSTANESIKASIQARGDPNVIALSPVAACDLDKKVQTVEQSADNTIKSNVCVSVAASVAATASTAVASVSASQCLHSNEPIACTPFNKDKENDYDANHSDSSCTEQLLRQAATAHANRLVSVHTSEIRPHSTNINNIWSQPEAGDRPPKPPPRRKSFASNNNTYLQKKHGTQDNEKIGLSMPKPFTDKLKEIHELAFNSPGRVKEHAKKLNKMVSESELRPPMPTTPNNGLSGNLHSSKDEMDAVGGASEQLKRRWMVKISFCDYNEMQQMLRECPKLAGFKDYISTALHWAAKFNKPEIIKLIAGTHGVSPNIKTNGGHTPLHLAAMFNNREIVELLIKAYGADDKIRDYAGRLPLDILRQNNNIKRKEALVMENSAIAANKHSGSLLARTASLRQTHRQLLERLPSKYRTVK